MKSTMARQMNRIRLWVAGSSFIISIIIVVAGLKLYETSSAFPTAEYRITIVDENGQRIIGYEAHLETADGSKCPGYPVVNYAHEPIRDDNTGTVILRHVSRPPEFSVSEWRLFGLPIHTVQGPPLYFLRCYKHNDCIAQIRYDDLVGLASPTGNFSVVQMSLPRFYHGDDMISEVHQLPICSLQIR